jgi:hypothetical protein
LNTNSWGKFHRIPPKDDSYRSPDWEPCLPVDLPPFLNTLLARQAAATAGSRCAYSQATGKPPRLIIADTTTWPGVPIAAWPAAPPITADPTAAVWQPPRGRGIVVIPDDTPLACWLPIKSGLTPHGLRHSHKTWMAEDGIPEILSEQRLGHEVPGMRGLYTHVSDTMRQDLTAKLQARWETSLRARAALHPRSPVPLLDELLAPYRTKPQPQPQPPRTRTPARRRAPAPAPAVRARKR